MRRWLGWIAIVWLLALCAFALVAYGSPTGSASLDDRTRGVALQLRCLVCQGESVADSPSDFARTVRASIHDRLKSGQAPDRIEAYLVSRYGNRILLAPPTTGIGSVAWLAPPLFALSGLGLLLILVVDWRNRGRVPAGQTNDIYLERVRAEVASGE